MAMREKLIELLSQVDACICTLCGEDGALERVTGVIADHLIANGVTIENRMPRLFVRSKQVSEDELMDLINDQPVVFERNDCDIIPIMSWIPVAELLPKVGQRILVYCESKTIEKHVTACTYMGGLYGHPQFSRHVRKVTHWMPLPEQPKGCK